MPNKALVENSLHALLTFLMASGLLLSWVGCTKSEVVGTWQAIRNDPDCGWEPSGAHEQLIFEPNGKYQRHYQSSDYWFHEEGRWSLSWLRPALEVDVTRTITAGGAYDLRVVTTFEYSLVGDQLWLTRTRSNFYAKTSLAQKQSFSGEPPCAYRRVVTFAR